MVSRVQKGNYYRLKTKKWLEADGYLVENLEHSQRIFLKDKDQVIFIKKDIWGADLIAKNKKEIIFIQCKTNKGDISSGIKELNTTIWPACVKLWVVRWPLRAREPEIVEVK